MTDEGNTLHVEPIPNLLRHIGLRLHELASREDCPYQQDIADAADALLGLEPDPGSPWDGRPLPEPDTALRDRMRIHDDGRMVRLMPADDRRKHDMRWLAMTEDGRRVWFTDSEVHEPGWHEALVLPVDDTGARKLAEAWYGGIAPHPGLVDVESVVALGRLDYARAVLDRLAEGGER